MSMNAENLFDNTLKSRWCANKQTLCNSTTTLPLLIKIAGQIMKLCKKKKGRLVFSENNVRWLSKRRHVVCAYV